MTTINLSALEITQEIAIIYISNDSSYSQSQIQGLKSKETELAQKSANLFILDQSQLSNLGNIPSFKAGQQGLAVTNKSGQILWSKFELDFKDLGQFMLDFTIDFGQDTTGKDIFCFGNVIPEEGDYLCNDCGYVLSVTKNGEFQPGMVFPTCEVCQSGEPDGPSGAHQDFWQKL